MRKTRYIREREANDFLETLWETSVTRQESVDGGFMYRAQIGAKWEQQDHGEGVVIDVPTPLDPDRMKPLTDRAREGRANPKGIPVIYLATEPETAVAEVRPWVGAYVSVGSFRITRPIRIVNFDAGDTRRKVYMKEPNAAERERAVWADIDRAFATPLNPADDVADYSPTQIVAELFRTRGLDGIAYRSSLAAGHNVALFNPDGVELESCQLVEVENVEFKIAWHGGGYTAASIETSN
jgi:hypothetical protein